MLNEKYYEESLKDFSFNGIQQYQIDFIITLLRHAYVQGQKDGLKSVRPKESNYR